MVRLMNKKDGDNNGDEVRVRPAVRTALVVGSCLLVVAVLWTVSHTLDRWNPGVAWISAKLAAKAAVALSVGLVALPAWLRKRG